VAILPNRVKPATCAQVMSKSVCMAVRGARVQRVEKDKSRNLGDPFRRALAQLLSRMHKALGVCSEVGGVHSSKEAGNDRGAKGRCHGSAISTTQESA
jgi:hypothetical protein